MSRLYTYRLAPNIHFDDSMLRASTHSDHQHLCRRGVDAGTQREASDRSQPAYCAFFAASARALASATRCTSVASTKFRSAALT
jgi:hypothetical protein